MTEFKWSKDLLTGDLSFSGTLGKSDLHTVPLNRYERGVIDDADNSSANMLYALSLVFNKLQRLQGSSTIEVSK